MDNLFQENDVNKAIRRITNLTPTTTPQWGKMNAPQMLAHLNVAYEMAYENKHKAPNFFMKFILKTFIKGTVVGAKPYKRNSQTAPAFQITDERNFEKERNRLIDYLKKTQELGADYFDGKESLSFGKLTKDEWNIMFAKHLDHHLTQFGV